MQALRSEEDQETALAIGNRLVVVERALDLAAILLAVHVKADAAVDPVGPDSENDTFC